MPALDTRPARRLVPFLVAGVGFLLAAAELALLDLAADVPLGDWLALHLALAGGVSLLIIGAAQYFACAALATDPPEHRLIAAQAICWTAGAVAMVLGAQLHERAPMVAAGWLCGVSLMLFVAGLRGMERRSLQRAPWATRWYYAAAGFLAAGGLLGVEMWRGAALAPGDVRAAHVALVVLGWCGTAIVGTLHGLLPALVGRRLALPALQRPAFHAWTAGVSVLATGLLAGVWPLSWLGVLALEAGAVLLVVNVVRTIALPGPPLRLPARLVVAGQGSLVAGLTLASVLVPVTAGGAIGGRGWNAVAVAVLVGWVGCTVLGSLVHLTRTVTRVMRLGARP